MQLERKRKKALVGHSYRWQPKLHLFSLPCGCRLCCTASKSICPTTKSLWSPNDRNEFNVWADANSSNSSWTKFGTQLRVTACKLDSAQLEKIAKKTQPVAGGWQTLFELMFAARLVTLTDQKRTLPVTSHLCCGPVIGALNSSRRSLSLLSLCRLLVNNSATFFLIIN